MGKLRSIGDVEYRKIRDRLCSVERDTTAIVQSLNTLNGNMTALRERGEQIDRVKLSQRLAILSPNLEIVPSHRPKSGSPA